MDAYTPPPTTASTVITRLPTARMRWWTWVITDVDVSARGVGVDGWLEPESSEKGGKDGNEKGGRRPCARNNT